MTSPKWILFFCGLSCFLYHEATEDKEIKGKPGDDVLLQCRSPRVAAIIVLKWIRPDLKSEGYVFFFRGSRSYENYQHPSFRGRVKLKDPEMKDGDVSVILKNVTINDTGTYECYVGYEGEPELINTINLTVDDSGHTAGNTGVGGLVITLSVFAFLLVAGIVGFIIYIIYKGRGRDQDQNQPSEQHELQQLPNDSTEAVTQQQKRKKKNKKK